MKKWIAGLLTAALLVGVVPAAMAATEAQSELTFRVGYGAANATPDIAALEIHMAGNFDTQTRIAQSVESGNELWMKAIAMSDGTTTKVAMTTDFIRVPIDWNLMVEEEVLGDPRYANTGIEAGFLSISATHTHSSVDIGDANNSKNVSQPAKWHTSNLDGDNAKKETTYFTNYWLPSAVAAVKGALDDLSEATIMTKSVAVADTNGKYNVNRVRHWFAANGTMAGVNFSNSDLTPVGRIRPADPELQLIRFVRSDKTDVVLVNWQMHPTGGMSEVNKTLTADYCGTLCNYLNENVEDCVAAYFQGAAGNVNALRTNDGESAPTGVGTGYKNYGTYVGKIAQGALSSMDVVPAGKVSGMRNETVVVERGYETYRTVQQDVITVGNTIAFVTAGYEMFDSNAMDVKRATKEAFFDTRDNVTTTNEGGYKVVFVIENSQGHEYMPNWQACHYTLLGGLEAYEVKEGCFNLVPGSAEDLADGLTYMLKTLNTNLAN